MPCVTRVARMLRPPITVPPPCCDVAAVHYTTALAEFLAEHVTMRSAVRTAAVTPHLRVRVPGRVVPIERWVKIDI